MNTLLDQYILPIIHQLIIIVITLLLMASVPTYAKDKSVDEAESQIESQIDGIKEELVIVRETLEALQQAIDASTESTSLTRTSVKSIRDGLLKIEKKMKNVYSRIDKNEPVISSNTNSMSSNTDSIAELSKEIREKAREIRANNAELLSQKSLIEDNSVRLYETLITVNTINEEVQALAGEIAGVKNVQFIEQVKSDIVDNLDQLWRLIAIILGFFAPLAFVISSHEAQYKALVDGTKQHQGALLVSLCASLGFFTVGFSLMYGTSLSGWIGANNYWLTPLEETTSPNTPHFTEFILFQAGFLVTGALIVYLAVGHKLAVSKHMLIALFVGTILFPIFGHWVWAGNFIPENNGWLQQSNFQDLAGAASIHIIAAWFSFFVVLKLQKILPNDAPEEDLETFDMPVYSTSAILMLWLSWIGFTTGNLSLADKQIPDVILNVGLAGAAGGLASYFHYALFHADKGRIARALGGFVTGLVAIAACAQTVTVIEAAFIGIVAGLLQNIAFGYLQRYFLRLSWQKRAAHIVSIHGIGGIWGILSVALLGTGGTFNAPNTTLLFSQLKGVGVALIYCLFMANVMMFVLKLFIRKHKKTV